MVQPTDRQLSLFAPAPTPPLAVRRTICRHEWAMLGIEVKYCLKCGKAFISVDGISFEDTWPLTKP
jgi:hypothetical protein